MTVPTVEELRQKLNANGSSMAMCPAHHNVNTPALSIGEKSGKVVFKCHGGCSQSAIIEALQAKGIWPKPTGITVAELAAAKSLPETLLRESGFGDDEARGLPVVRIQYRDAGGRVICTRYRGGGDGPRFWFRKGDHQQLYGLWRLKSEPVIVVEGETDSIALWSEGFNAIGVPGAEAWKDAQFAPHLEACPTLYVHIEPDRGGEKFRAAFERSRLRDRVRFFTVPGAKDPCELRARNLVNFRQAIETALTGANAVSIDVEVRSPPEPLKIIRMADVIAKPIVAVWSGALYEGKVTVGAGLPGDGKSAMSTDVIARASVGGPLPCGEGRFRRMACIMLTAEDDPSDTIRPRLDVAGADLERVELIAGAYREREDGTRELDTVALLEDLPAIETLIRERSARHNERCLLVIDPLTSFAGGSDTNKTGDTRRLLDSVAQTAARTAAAVLIITHLNKRSDARKAMQMIAGSHVITAAVRIALVTARDPNDRHRRLLLPVKINIDSDDGGFAFRIEAAEHSVAGSVPRVIWESARVLDINADDALIDSTPRAQAAVEKANEAQDWLRDYLHREPVQASTMWRAAKEKGFSERRVRSALKAIGAISEVMGYQGKWHYRLSGAPESDGKRIHA